MPTLAPLTPSLYLVPTPLDFGCATLCSLESQLPLATIQTAAQITHWVVENAKSARAFLKRVNAISPLTLPLQEQHIVELSKHKDTGEALLQPLRSGQPLGILSEAGMPGIADPGALLVRAAHQENLPVTPLLGPTSIVLALAASGMNGQQFAFNGYLPQDSSLRVKAIAAFERLSRESTQIFIETPYRNMALLSALVQHLSPRTHLCVAAGLGLKTAPILRSVSVFEWRKKDWEVDLKGIPAIFLFSSAQKTH